MKTKHSKTRHNSTLLMPLVNFVVLSSAAFLISHFIDLGGEKTMALGGEQAPPNPDRLGSGSPYGDYLAWYREQAADPEAGDRALFKKLADCRVSTPEEARKIALQYKLPMSAQEGCSINRLIRVARDVPEFANKGDFVWAVQFGMLIPDVLGTQGVSDELWVSSTSGAVISVFKGNVEPGADSPDEKAPEVE